MSTLSPIWSLVFGPLVERLASAPWWKRLLLLPFLWARSLGLLGGAVAVLSITANFKGVVDDNASARQVTELSGEVAQMKTQLDASARQVSELGEKSAQMRTLLDIVKVALDSRAAQLDPPATQVAHCDPRQLTEAASDLRRLSDKLAAALRVHDGVGLQPPPPRLPAVSDQSPVANEKVLTPGAPAQPAATTGSDDDAMPAHDAPSAQRPTGARVDSAPQAPRSEGLQAGPSAPSPPAVQTGKSTANFAHPVALDQTIVANDEPYSTVLLNVVSPRVVGPDGQASTAEVEKIEIAQAPADSRVVLVLGDDDTPVASGRLSYAQLMGLKAKFITDGCGGSTSFRYRVWYGGRFDDATFNIVRNRIKPKGTCPNDDRSAPSNR